MQPVVLYSFSGRPSNTLGHLPEFPVKWTHESKAAEDPKGAHVFFSEFMGKGKT